MKIQCTDCGLITEAGKYQEQVEMGLAIHCSNCNRRTIHEADKKNPKDKYKR